MTSIMEAPELETTENDQLLYVTSDGSYTPADNYDNVEDKNSVSWGEGLCIASRMWIIRYFLLNRYF